MTIKDKILAELGELQSNARINSKSYITALIAKSIVEKHFAPESVFEQAIEKAMKSAKEIMEMRNAVKHPPGGIQSKVEGGEPIMPKREPITPKVGDRCIIKSDSISGEFATVLAVSDNFGVFSAKTDSGNLVGNIPISKFRRVEVIPPHHKPNTSDVLQIFESRIKELSDWRERREQKGLPLPEEDERAYNFELTVIDGLLRKVNKLATQKPAPQPAPAGLLEWLAKEALCVKHVYDDNVTGNLKMEADMARQLAFYEVIAKVRELGEAKPDERVKRFNDFYRGELKRMESLLDTYTSAHDIERLKSKIFTLKECGWFFDIE